MSALRQELHGYVDEIPEEELAGLRPVLVSLVPPVIDNSPLTEEELAIIAEGRAERAAHPESFIALADVLARNGL
jgi:hypothetical protein